MSPRAVIDAGIESLRNGYTHYTGNTGLLSLRKAISKYLEKEYSLQYNPENQILITVGVSQGIDLAFRSILNPQEAIIYSAPSYVSYGPLIELAGGIPIVANASFENGFRFGREEIAEVYKKNAKALFLNYPNNPTGASLEISQLKSLAQFVKEKDMLVISDEIYAELTYSGKHIPMATMDGMYDRTLTLGGFSKSFAMTGWRIGYACGPAPWIKALTKIHQYSMLCAPVIGQIAAESALKNSLMARDEMKDSYQKRRDFIVEGFNSMGLECHLPQGAFYVFPDIRSTRLSSMSFARNLLEKQKIAVVPGTAFGTNGEGFIRCSYATASSEIEKALNRIQDFIAKVE